MKNWLKSVDVKTMLYANYAMPCKVISGPNNTNVSNEDWIKQQNGQMVIDFSNDKLTTFFKNDLKVN